MIGLEVDIKIDEGRLAKDIKTEILVEFKKRIDKLKTTLQKTISTQIENIIRADETYQSLLSGKLEGDLGIPPDVNLWVQTAMVSQIAQSLLITIFTPQFKQDNLDFAISLEILGDDFVSLTKDTKASYTYFSTKQKQDKTIPWLDWLLLEGEKTLVQSYYVEYGAFPNSRTGKAIMVQKDGTGFSIDGEHAGTANDNFITRAIAKYEHKLQDFIEKDLETVFE